MGTKCVSVNLFETHVKTVRETLDVAPLIEFTYVVLVFHSDFCSLEM